MINITEQQEKILEKYLPNYKEYNKLGDLLDILDDIMLDSLIDEEAGPETPIISKLYDEIYAQNK